MGDFGFQKLLEKAPKPIQDFLFTDEFSLLLKDAANLAKLNDNQAVRMGDIVANTLLGVIPIEKFKEELHKQLDIPESSIEILDKIIQQKIIEPFRNELKQIQPLKIKTVFPSSAPKTPSAALPPLSTFKREKTETKREETKKEKSEERKKPLEPTIKPIEVKETQTEKEEIKLTEIKIPEAVEIQIEKPIQKEIDIQPISLPEIPLEKKEKIKEILLKTMTSKKTEKPKIVEEMEKVAETPNIPQNQKEEPKKEKAVVEISQTSKVIAGQNNNFSKTETVSPKTQDKPPIFEMKIKEIEKKEEELPEAKRPISYKKYRPEKPFGET